MTEKIFPISFGIEKLFQNEEPKIQQNKEEILDDNVKIEGYFNFYNYIQNATIGDLKEYFLTNFSKKYPYCKCLFFVYYKNSINSDKNKYKLLTTLDDKKLSEFEHSKLYLIKINSLCNCEFKTYSKYMIMKKFEIISKLKDLDINKEDKEKKFLN